MTFSHVIVGNHHLSDKKGSFSCEPRFASLVLKKITSGREKYARYCKRNNLGVIFKIGKPKISKEKKASSGRRGSKIRNLYHSSRNEKLCNVFRHYLANSMCLFNLLLPCDSDYNKQTIKCTAYYIVFLSTCI